jgi:hypothetical protein
MKFFVRGLLGAIPSGVAAWFAYAGVMAFAYPFEDRALVSQDTHQVLAHQISFVSSISLLGVVIGMGTRRSLKSTSVLVLASVASVISWLLFIRYRIESLHERVQSATDAVPFLIGIRDVPLYEVGLVSAFVVSCVGFFLSCRKDRSGSVASNP